MIWWGVILGAVLGAMWAGDITESLVAGAIVGGAVAAALRSTIQVTVREEVRKAFAQQEHVAAAQAAHVAASAAAPRPVAIAAPAASVTPEPIGTPMAAPPAREPEFADTMPGPAHAEAPSPRPPAHEAHPDFATVLAMRFRDWLLGGNTVVRVGIVVLFVGLAFLAKYAIDNALLPPELRLAGIGAAGIALFAAGFRLRQREGVHRGYALTLQGGGVAVLYLTVFAAFRLYGFLPAGAAFAALALICAFSAVIAVAQDAMAMAFIGFAGGFAAPLLVSTGSGSHVALFSYYALLGVAIAALAWFKAWRALNLLGFVATFAVATAWGSLQYEPSKFATTEPFLVLFFAIYLVAALLYALRHSLASVWAVDATLIFGVPLVGFGLQASLVREIEYGTAFSSLALGALYLALTAWMLRSRTADERVRRWLAECFLALGLGFVTLAVPLALDTRWTAAVWAVEGATVFWMGRHQSRWIARFVGLALQPLAAIAFLEATAWIRVGNWPVVHPAFMGALMLAASAFLVAWQCRDVPREGRSAIDTGMLQLERHLAPLAFWAGFLWWQFALRTEILRETLDAAGLVAPVYDKGLRLQLTNVGWVASAFALHWLAVPARARPWGVAATPAWTVLPWMFAMAVFQSVELEHAFVSGGWIVWPVVLVMHLAMLRKLDTGAPLPWWPIVHAGGVWLLVLLAGNALVFAINRAQLWQTAWASVILLVACTAVLLLLSRKAWFTRASQRRGWPLDRFGLSYLWIAALPVVIATAWGALLVAVESDGDARPLPFVPLLNPTDLSVALAIAACALWLMRIRDTPLAVAPVARDRRLPFGLAALAFVAANTVWLRIAHHFAHVPWDAAAMFRSFVVQAGYSILWTLIAVWLMVMGHRRAMRPLWMTGAGLLGLTVFKLFVIDLSNRGGSERIVVFIAVGVLMLVVGYFAPLPPATSRKLQSAGEAS